MTTFTHTSGKGFKIIILLLTQISLMNCHGSVDPPPMTPEKDVAILHNVNHGFGGNLNTRDNYQIQSLPLSIDHYKSIRLIVDLHCPSGGCDPWDRFAKIEVIKNNDTLEIARYVTPYGIGCTMEFDVSDYRSYLTGEVTIHSFIDTWVNPGWSVSANLVYSPGEPEYKNVEIARLYSNDYLVYGDPDRPPIIPIFHLKTDALKTLVRIINTGHGQGNASNAAEFYEANHTVKLNENTITHHLWRANCSQTNCSPQNGTWTLSRAGWCPGSPVLPADFPAPSHGSSLNFQYVLEDYLNTCSPEYTACDGSTCAIGNDCQYNYNGHTEPHYKIEIQAIYYR